MKSVPQSIPNMSIDIVCHVKSNQTGPGGRGALRDGGQRGGGPTSTEVSERGPFIQEGGGKNLPTVQTDGRTRGSSITTVSQPPPTHHPPMPLSASPSLCSIPLVAPALARPPGIAIRFDETGADRPPPPEKSFLQKYVRWDVCVCVCGDAR